MMTREQWLTVAAIRLGRTVVSLTSAEAPENVRWSVGIPSKKRGRGAQGAGQGLFSVHASGESTGGQREVFISPTLDGERAGAAVLIALCEIAAATGGRASGLTLENAAPVADAVLRTMPTYPHDAMRDTRTAGGSTGSRLIKAACPACGYTVRVTRKWIAVGLPICPTDGETFVAEGVAPDAASE
jgi:hypothetical protein